MEIKFRVWDGKQMWYSGDSYELSDRGEYYIDQSGVCCEADLNGHPKPKKRLAPMLWTGLQDANGKDIYEGDVVGYNNQYSGMYHTDIVKFVSGRFIPVSDIDEFENNEWVNIRVLGNVHEQPELAKGGGE